MLGPRPWLHRCRQRRSRSSQTIAETLTVGAGARRRTQVTTEARGEFRADAGSSGGSLSAQRAERGRDRGREPARHGHRAGPGRGRRDRPGRGRRRASRLDRRRDLAPRRRHLTRRRRPAARGQRGRLRRGSDRPRDRPAGHRSAASARSARCRPSRPPAPPSARAGWSRSRARWCSAPPPDNPVPLPDDAPVAAAPGRRRRSATCSRSSSVLARTPRAHPGLAVTRAAAGGTGRARTSTPIVTRHFEAPRLLTRARSATTLWQFCHVDDVATAVVTALVAGARRRADRRLARARWTRSGSSG